MPAINKEWYPHTDLYNSVDKKGKELNERNDCTIVALTIVTNKPYEECKSTLESHGKRRRQGCKRSIQLKALKTLGFKTRNINPEHFLNQYPEVHKRQLKNITTHQPDRFPHVFRDGRTYLLYNPNHVAAMINGKVHDWTRGRRRKVVQILEVLPVDADFAPI